MDARSAPAAPKFLSSLEVIAPGKFLAVHDHLLLTAMVDHQRCGLVAVLIEKVESKSRRHVRLKDAEFHAPSRNLHQWSAMRPVRFPAEMVVMPGTVLMSVAMSALMLMLILVSMMVGMCVRMTFATVIMFVGMRMRVLAAMRQMHIELRPRNRPPFLP